MANVKLVVQTAEGSSSKLYVPLKTIKYITVMGMPANAGCLHNGRKMVVVMK